MIFNKKYYLLFLILSFFFAKCGNEKVNSISSYKNWFEKPENNYVQTKEVGNYIFTVKYRPSSYLILNELNNSTHCTKKILDSLLKQYEQCLNFILVIENKNKEEIFKLNQDQIKELEFDLTEKIKLKLNDKEIYPALYHLEQGYELANKLCLDISFPNNIKDKKIEMNFSFNDDVFKTYELNFNFKLDLNKIPNLPIKIVD